MGIGAAGYAGDTVSERNKAAARAVFEVWSTGEIERLDELVARHVVHHDPYDPHAAEGLVGMKRTIDLNRRVFPDMQLTVEDQVAEGDKVVTRWRGVMTHTGKLMGAAPTGRRVTITGITIDRFEEGKIVEAWRSMDMLGLFQGIGVREGA
jgi:predicted ester cyclase